MLYQQNCITGSQLYIPNDTADLLIADPPYNLGYSGTKMTSNKQVRFQPIHNDKLSDDEYRRFMLSWMKEAHRVLKPGRHIYVCIDWRKYGLVATWLEFSGFTIKNCVVWDKVHFGMGYQYRYQHEFIIMATKGRHKARRTGIRSHSDIWRFPRVPGNQTIHPHEKPLALLERIISNSSQPGELVIDFFSGSGVAAAAAKKLGREWIAFETDPQHAQTTLQRVEQTEPIAEPEAINVPSRGRQRTRKTALRQKRTTTRSDGA